MEKAWKLRVDKFHLKFLNLDISLNHMSIIIKCLQDDLKTIPEGRVSQSFDQGSSYFILNDFFHYFLYFIA